MKLPVFRWNVTEMFSFSYSCKYNINVISYVILVTVL